MQVVIGGVYLVDDAKLRLLPRNDRKLHPERPVVVVSGATNSDVDWPMVAACPLSTSSNRQTRVCVRVGAGEAGLDRISWIRVAAIQPLEKDDLLTHLGTLDETTLLEVQARLADYLGMLDVEEADPDTDWPAPENVPF